MRQKKILVLSVPAIIVLGIDQLTKWIIRTTPELQSKTLIDGWLEFYYTQNPGMAMGIDWLPTPVISGVAILATMGILIYLIRSLDKASIGYLAFMGLIIGGALGNISDRIFMGYVYGNGGVLEGHVIDFIYFSLRINDWTVFPYIFNVADIAISVSIISLLVFNKRLLQHDGVVESEEANNTTEVADSPSQA